MGAAFAGTAGAGRRAAPNADRLPPRVTPNRSAVGTLLDAVVIGAVLGTGLFLWIGFRDTRHPSVSDEDWRTLTMHGRGAGPPDAAVTIVEFIDYQCPFCANVEAILSDIATSEPHRIRRVLIHYPMPQHPNAVLGAMAVDCAAEQKRLIPMHNLLFELRGDVDSITVGSVAARAGVRDLPRFSECLGRESTRLAVERDRTLGRRLGVTGTPTLVINRVWLERMRPVEVRAFIRDRL